MAAITKTSVLVVLASVVLTLTGACAGGATAPPATAPVSSPVAPSARAISPVPSQAAPGEMRPAPEPIKVTVAVPGVGISFLPVELGLKAGVFQAEGIDLELSSMQPPVAFAALASDQVDYVLTVGEGIRAALAGLAPIKLVGGITNGVDWFLYGAGNVRTMQDLKGKVIGVGGPKGEVELGARAAVSAAGLDLERDQIGFRTGLLTPDRMAQMQQNTLDAAIIAAPAQFRADDMGFHRLSNIGELVELPIVAWGTSENKVRSRPEEVKRLLRASIRSMDYLFTHQDEAVAYIQEKFQLNSEQARASLELDLRLFARDGELPESGVKNWLKVLADTGELPSANIPTERFEDLSLLREVQRELGVR